MVFLKNSLTLSARKYFLKKSQKTLKHYFLIFCTFLPPFFITTIRTFFRGLRFLKQKINFNSEFKEAQNFVDSLEKN